MSAERSIVYRWTTGRYIHTLLIIPRTHKYWTWSPSSQSQAAETSTSSKMAAASPPTHRSKTGDQSLFTLYFGWSIAVKECETQLGPVNVHNLQCPSTGLVQGSVQGYDCFWLLNYNNWLRWWYLNNLSLNPLQFFMYARRVSIWTLLRVKAHVSQAGRPRGRTKMLKRV
jgi:hypothetical protein